MNKIVVADAHQADLRGSYAAPELLDYVLKSMVQEPIALQNLRHRAQEQGLPPWQIGPLEGKILEFLAHAAGAKKAVEVGTLGGYSACWIALGLSAKGKLYTLEYNPDYAKTASQNIKEAGCASKVEIIVGDAGQTLKKLAAIGPFDFCFIDADKAHYPVYLRWAIRHLRPGGIVALDNAFLFGKLHLDPREAGGEAESVRALQTCLTLLSDKKLFSSCAMLPTGEGMAIGIIG